MVDCARAAILLPLGSSILNCQPVNKCSLVETAFLLLVTVSTVNMLTTVLNDSPVFPESDEEADLTAPLLMDSPQVREGAIARFVRAISALATNRVNSRYFLAAVSRRDNAGTLQSARILQPRLSTYLPSTRGPSSLQVVILAQLSALELVFIKVVSLPIRGVVLYFLYSCNSLSLSLSLSLFLLIFVDTGMQRVIIYQWIALAKHSRIF